ncbi:MAG TPA: DNA polymerase I [Candidatus Scybalocola faecavium]|nr:DNA polymerase I [Candidatus Scybalocola faecavium]
MSKAVLIDGLSILNRAFYGIPDLTNSEGLHTNAVYGFLNIMFKILDEEHPQYLGVAFDVSAPTFRHKLFDDYKGTRKAMPDELRQQIPVMKDVLAAMHIKTLEKEGYEADDIIGTLCAKCEAAGMDVSVISGDRDLLQLATDKVKIRIPKTKMTGTEIEDYYAADVQEKYHVTPTEFIDMKALMGDASDNIPGVPSIGEKTAAKIISAYKNIETAYAHASEIKPKKASENLVTYWEQAKLSKVLAAIDTHCPIDISPQELAVGDMYTPEAYLLFKRLEFKNIISRFDQDTAPAALEIPKARQETSPDLLWEACDTYGGTCAGIYYHDQAPTGLCVSLDGPDHSFFISEDICSSQAVADGLIGRGYILCLCHVKETLAHIKLPQDKVFDSSIAAYLINPLKDTYNYDDIARDFLGITLPSHQDIFGKNSHEVIRGQNSQTFDNFLGWNCAVPRMSYEPLKDALAQTQMDRLYEEIELPLAFVLRSMEDYGIKTQRDALKAYGDALISRIRELEKNIYDLAGEEFNINSPKQLGVILFEKLRLPYGKKTKTGYSTSAEVLEKLRTEDPIVNFILEYRQLTKLKSTYADGLEGYIQEDGRIHGKFHQTITATGRISSTEPNLQNIPIRMELGRLIRKVFVPEDGYVFVDADYSQIELRVLAHMSGDQNLIQAYREEQDIHKITASQVFHTPLDQVTPLQRRNAKAVNFGIVYGISSFGLSQDLSITRKEAGEYIEKYFQTYPQVKAFLDRMVSDAREKGYSITLFGRRRPMPELKSSNFMQRSFGERIAMNSPIQGTAADIIKIAMIRVKDRLESMNLKSRLILQVHDELLIEAAKDEESLVRDILKEEMENAAHLEVPLEIDIHTGNNWYEAK